MAATRTTRRRAAPAAIRCAARAGWCAGPSCRCRRSSEDLTGAKRRQLARLSPQAFRHTFSTLSAATDVPLDVVQQLLDHASLQATSVSVTAEQKRCRRELAKYYGSREKTEAAACARRTHT
ncbi:tyrosine-type recombinase/integrase [Burkholderia ubonensis]|uniref:tyrosine-type recombinase/integrase n=1 Tax=Burkholderia ubonensis TaxID=101571 RepID=UPI001E588276|nr:tyrosine-type recombinase/integrase [Burkholderia ubonensis]